MQNETSKGKWYENNIAVHVFLILFFPVGLYLLWKSRTLPKWWKITASIITALVVISVANNEEKNKGKTSESGVAITNKDSEGKTKGVSLPAEEAKFTEAVNLSKKEYDDAPNELKKSAVRSLRSQRIANALSNLRVINNWVGTVSKMETNSEGKAIFAVTLEGTDITLTTWNNAVSDVVADTLIPQNSDMFKTIAEMNKGDRVLFSGFFQSSSQDFVEEQSMSEDGSMTDPEFTVKFSSVKKF